MKIDIPYYIRQVLREQRKVYVPEIGTFALSQQPASFAAGRASLLPPYLSIGFDEVAEPSDALRKYIFDTGRYNGSKIDKAISKYSQSLYNGLVNINQVEVEKLGKLTKSNNGIKFVPTLRDLTDEFVGLPSVAMSPIQYIQDNQEVEHAISTADISQRPSTKTPWWYPVVAGLLIASLFILFKKGCYDKHQASVDTIEQGIIDDATNKEIKNELDSKYKEVDEILGVEPDSGLGGGKIKEELSHLDEDEGPDEGTIETTVEEDPVVEEIEQPVSGTKTNETKSIDESVEDSTPGEEVATSAGVSKYSSIIPASGQCIIILGSFTKARNISKMTSKIEREGLTPYQSQFQGKTRVGFKVNCTGVDIGNYLNDIRERFDSKAWFLDPSISIPYR